MKTVTILEAFDGYPQAPREGARRVSYAEGQEIEVSDAFADLIIGKSLARETKPKPAPKTEPAAAEPKKDDAP